MFTVVKRSRRAAFTLLEITLAVAILAMMSMAIYRFVAANLNAVRISTDANAVDARYSGFLALLTEQLQSLPPGNSTLTGEPLKLNDRTLDEITWHCDAGPGLLTRYGVGRYGVSLRIRPVSKGSAKLEIGVMRKPESDSSTDSADESWVPLLSNVQDLQIRYFDPRLNTWVDRWPGGDTLPRLVKVVIGRLDSLVAWEAVIPLGRTSLL